MALFAIRNLSFRYPQSTALALDDVTLDIREGEMVLLCGRSGCGKTTLLRHLKTVLAPHGQKSGSVLFEGTPLDEVPARRQVGAIGFVMQNPDAQVVTDKVWHELAFGLESLGTDQRTMRLRVAEMASYFGIQNWFRKDVCDLSGGQKQLLNLASVMAMQPEVLILDEPTSQLDPIAASDFLNTVRKINRELGTAVIITEHRLEDVYAFADRVAVMEGGSLLTCGTPREVGEHLHRSGNPMEAALPAPMRICYGVEGARGVRAQDVAVCYGAEEASDEDGAADGGAPASFADGPGGDRASCEGARARSGKIVPGVEDDAEDGDACEGGAGAVPLTVREGRVWLEAETAIFPPAARSLPDETPRFAPEAKPAVELKEVWFRYDRNLPDVLRDTSLTVSQGCLYAVVGGNGTGKSTMLRIICGALAPYRGKVSVLGRTLKEWRRQGGLFQGGLAMLPQDPLNLMVRKTVRADLEEMLEGRGLDSRQREDEVARVAALTDIGSILDAHPFDLSGGEVQRAALAKVLLCCPRLLLLDEPTKGLDNFFKAKFAALLRRLIDEGVTVVMVSHDVEFCAAYADEVAMFFDGSVAAADTPRRFFASNSFYTTAANRMSRGIFANAVTDEDVIHLCTDR